MGDPAVVFAPASPTPILLFHAFNANKSRSRSISSPPGLELVKDMIRQADVMIGTLPSAHRAAGLSYDVVKAIIRASLRPGQPGGHHHRWPSNSE